MQWVASKQLSFKQNKEILLFPTDPASTAILFFCFCFNYTAASIKLLLLLNTYVFKESSFKESSFKESRFILLLLLALSLQLCKIQPASAAYTVFPT